MSKPMPTPETESVFVGQIWTMNMCYVVGVFTGSGLATQHVNKALHNDHQMGRNKFTAIAVRRFLPDHPNTDPNTLGEEEMVYHRVVRAGWNRIEDGCPCEYCIVAKENDRKQRTRPFPDGVTGEVSDNEQSVETTGLPIMHSDLPAVPEPTPAPENNGATPVLARVGGGEDYQALFDCE